MRQSSGARGIRQQRGHWTWAAHAQELAARGRVAQGRWNELMLLPPQKTQKDITAVKIAAGESSSPNFRNPGKMMFVVHAIFLATGYFLIAWCSLVAKDEDAILDDYAEAHQKLSDLGCGDPKMNHPAILAAAAAAVTAVTATYSVALSATADSNASKSVKGSASSLLGGLAGSGSRRGGSKNDKFAPTFDGMRFIETLVTAHR